MRQKSQSPRRCPAATADAAMPSSHHLPRQQQVGSGGGVPAEASKAPKKKRRLAPIVVAPPTATQPAASAQQAPPQLSCGVEGVAVTLAQEGQDGDGGGGGALMARLRLPVAAVETVHSVAQLGALLRRETRRAAESSGRWVRSPHAAWIQELQAELGGQARQVLLAQQRKMQSSGAADFGSRWELGVEYASLVVELWLADKSLEAVLAKCEAQAHGELPSGFALSGRWVERLATQRSVGLRTELLPWVGLLTEAEQRRRTRQQPRHGPTAASKPATASLFRISAANAFHTEPSTQAAVGDELAAELEERLASGRGGCGSLNTTFDYASSSSLRSDDDDDAMYEDEDEDDHQDERLPGSGSSGVELLDSWFSQLDEECYALGEDTVRLNPRLYMIWKMQHYCTPHHQDVHIPPHFTVYNQVCGLSTFHFLPLLLGLFAAHVGKVRGPAALAALLLELGRRQIGQLCTIGPKQMVLILPFGSHGVFVPPALANPSLSSRSADLSLIRAAELFLWPLHRAQERECMRTAGGGSSATATMTQPPSAEGSGTEALGAAGAGEKRAEEDEEEEELRWASVIELTAEERARETEQLRRFEAAQQQLCDAQGLSRIEWFELAQKLWRRWEPR